MPGFTPTVKWNCELPEDYVFAVIVPEGVGTNASRIDSLIILEYRRLVGSVAAQQAETIANNVLSRISQELARNRVELLAREAGVDLPDPDIVLYPIRIRVERVTVTGEKAPVGLEERITIARFLSFAVFFVLNPAAVAIADAFVGERERGTAELLAASPLRPRELVLGKLAGGLLLAVMAAAIDAAGVLAYLYIAGLMGFKGLGADLALVHAVETLLAVVVTAALAAPVSIAAPTPRSATMGSMMITGIATAIFFASFFVDLDKLPVILQAILYMAPYTHTAIAIQSYALGDSVRALLHTLAILAYTAVALLVAVKVYDPEKFVRQV